MRLNKCILGMLFTCSTASVAVAQDIQVLMLNGDVVPGVGTVDNGFSSPFIRCRVDDAGNWMIQFEYDNTNDDAIMRNGAVILQDGDAPPGGLPAGTTISDFDSWSINNSGDIVWGLFLDGTPLGTADNGTLYVNNTLIAQEGSTPIGTWGAGSTWLTFEEMRITDDLSRMRVIGRVDDPTTTATGSDYYVSLWSLDGSLNLTTESVLARGFETLTGMTAPEEVNTLRTSFDGSAFNNLGHIMFGASVRNAIGGSSADSIVYLNTTGVGGAGNVIVAQEGMIEAGSGQAWGSLPAPELDLNNSGDWVLRDTVTGPTSDIIVKNGVLFKFENDTHPDFPGEDIDSFGNIGAKITASGDVVWFGDFSGDSASDTAFFLNDTLLVREGVTMTNGGGLIDELRGFNSTNAISPDGRFLIFECEVNNVDAVCLLDRMPPSTDLCTGDGGDQMGCTNCPCANNATVGSGGGCLNSSGNGTRLNSSGDTSVSLPSGDTTDLRFGADGVPATAFCILNSGDALAPSNMANPCFGLGSGAQAMAFDGLRCAITNTRRHGGRSADANGEVGVTNDPWGGEGGPPAGIAVAGGGFVAGQTRYFQIINRDDPMMICMRGLNTSQAIEITFTP